MIVLLLGGNLGDRMDKLDRACSLIESRVGAITKSSSSWETETWGFRSDNSFLNRVVCAEWTGTPLGLLDILQGIETEMGRERKGDKYADRPIDIDILFIDSKVISSSRLVVPHPRLHQRIFTLVPLNEVLPDFMHPLLQKTVSSLLEDCEDDLDIKKYIPL